MSSLTSLMPGSVSTSESGDMLGDLVDNMEKMKVVTGNEEKSSAVAAPEKYIKHPLQVSSCSHRFYNLFILHFLERVDPVVLQE